MSRRDARWTVAPRYDLQRVPIPLSAAARRWHSRGLWRRASLRVVPPLPGCRPHSGASDAARFGAALGIGPPDEVLARRPRYVAGGLYHRLVRAGRRPGRREVTTRSFRRLHWRTATPRFLPG